MSWQAWFVLALTIAMITAMARGRAPDLVLLGGLALVMALEILPSDRALAGFANEGMLTVGALFVVAAGIRETGALDLVARRFLGRPRSVAGAQLRMMTPTAALSAFLNNTPIVAVATPLVVDWARRIGISPSKLLIPLSYATIVGGTCTLIGTSTNLVVHGFARKAGVDQGLFDIAWVGVPVALVGIAYVLVASRWLLPDRLATLVPANPREYGVTIAVSAGAMVVGRSIEAAGLRHLPGLYLAEIERGGERLAAVGPETRIEAGDRLLFVGMVESVADLRKIRGLVPVGDEEEAAAWQARDRGRRLVEAVVAVGSSLVGRSVRESQFRTVYGAAILAVHRRGERVLGKVGDIELRPGDTLLLEAGDTFLRQHRHDPDFALAAEVSGSEVPRHDKAWISGLALLAMIGSHVFAGVPLLTAAMIAGGALVATRCLSGPDAVRSLDVRVLAAIAASFGIGEALDETGVAATLARGLVRAVDSLGPVAILAGVYVATALLTECITNNAAAALMFPLAKATADEAGLALLPFVFIVMMAASASFSTPIGYQTNLMVYGPGGYRFSDFLRFGIPLQVVLAVVSVTIVSWRWL